MQRLTEFNIKRAGHLARLTKSQLYSVFGRRGDFLHDLSRGIDSDPVQPQEQKSAIYREYILVEDSSDRGIVEGVVTALTVRIGIELRGRGLTGRRLALQLDYTDGTRVVRQAVGRQGISDDLLLQEMALLVLTRAWGRRTRVRGCRVWVDRLSRKSPQLRLFDDPQGDDKVKEYLLSAMDKIRSKFGTDAVRFARQAVLH